MWCSAAHRGVTVVTVITIVFTPFWRHGEQHLRHTATQKTTTVVPCQPNAPCPRHVTIVHKQIEPATPPEPTTNNGLGHQRGHHSEHAKFKRHNRH
jgi:hypothetical protein